MSTKLKFMFDECLGEPMMVNLKALVPGDCHFEHVVKHYKSGTKDNVWISQLAKEGGWVVISGDRAKIGRQGGKLPQLCEQHHITHILLSKTFHDKKNHEKLAALALLWPEICQVFSEPPGTRFLLRYKKLTKRGGLTLVLQKYEKPTDPGPNPVDAGTTPAES